MEEIEMQNQKKTIKRISIPRLLFSFLVMGGIAYGATHSFANLNQMLEEDTFSPWFASYVDVTSTPTYGFEQPRKIALTHDVVLAFIVAGHDEACTPTWGGYYTLDEAASSLDLDRRIARLQQQGGKIAVSFGGALNKELGFACADEEALFDAYKSVIDRYNINTIDLDLEGDSLRDQEAANRRASVISRLQESYEEDNKHLVVWVTLPVTPQGLTEEGTNAISAFLTAGVDLAGVNIMTMDYGGSKQPAMSMYEASRLALVETHRQLGILYRRAGLNLTSSSLWSKMGATPMIGQNDVVEEVFTLEDAVLLNQFAREQGVGRMSMWSANRDIPCGENYVDVKIVSDVCSGVSTPHLSFGQALSSGFAGSLMQQASLSTTDVVNEELIVDDPKTSPYQIWRETGVYVRGTKVVWKGNVYEAKWWTKNELPDNPVLQSWETPWQLIGPVLSTDKPMEQLTLPSHLFPQWSGYAIYDAGDRVVFEGTVFRAKWWNQGESPAASVVNSESSPWIPLSQEQVKEILGIN